MAKNKEESFKAIQFEIQLEGRNAPQKRTDKKSAIELAQRTVKKYPGRQVRFSTHQNYFTFIFKNHVYHYSYS